MSGLIVKIYAGEANVLTPVLRPVERLFYRLAGVDETREQTWLAYAMAMIAFSIVGFLSLYALQRLQGVLPLNPQQFPGVPSDLAFNTSISFITNTNWQNYAGETDDEPSDPDARPHRPQFPLRRDRSRHGLRAGARLRALDLARRSAISGSI